MEQNRNDKKFSSQPGKKTEMPSKTSTATTRPEIDLPLKGGRNESDLASKKPSVKSDKAGFDKKSVR